MNALSGTHLCSAIRSVRHRCLDMVQRDFMRSSNFGCAARFTSYLHTSCPFSGYLVLLCVSICHDIGFLECDLHARRWGDSTVASGGSNAAQSSTTRFVILGTKGRKQQSYIMSHAARTPPLAPIPLRQAASHNSSHVPMPPGRAMMQSASTVNARLRS